MNILRAEEAPFHELQYRSVTARGPASDSLPFLRVTVNRLPRGIDALVLTSDLQGRAAGAGRGRLLGLVVAEELQRLEQLGELPALARTGVLLAGDLHCDEDQRGGLGDVRPVWRAFANHCAWVVGVPGNHDAFGNTESERTAFQRGPNWQVLDLGLGPRGDATEVQGFRIAGVAGIIGRTDKPYRREEGNFVSAVTAQLANRPDIAITHQHPQCEGVSRPGSAAYRQVLERHTGLVMFGHTHVQQPVLRFGRTCSALCTDGRLFVLTETVK